MASKRRIRRKACSGKQRFPTAPSAADAMHSLLRAGKKGGGHLHVYRCPFCRGFHYGHAPSKRGKQ